MHASKPVIDKMLMSAERGSVVPICKIVDETQFGQLILLFYAANMLRLSPKSAIGYPIFPLSLTRKGLPLRSDTLKGSLPNTIFIFY